MKVILVLAFVLAGSALAFGQRYTKPRYIGMAKAKTIAAAQVKGRIVEAEREREHGKVIYSFDIKGDHGQRHEVNIDAVTGEVIANTVESAADEAKEKAEDKKPGKH